MKSVAIVGQGFVGGSLTTVLSERGQKVYVFDKTGKVASGGIDILSAELLYPGEARFNLDESKWNISEFVQCCEATPDFSGIYFVCVPTPMHRNGSADLSIVESVLRDLADASGEEGRERIAVVKSTVPPGSTQHWNDLYGDRLRVIFCPEFLTEANALDDMRNQDRIVLGGPRPHINKVKQFFQRAFPKVPIIKTSSSTAEMVKYVTNVHLAIKALLANELSQVCEALDARGFDIDYDKVIEYATKDTRLGTSHWQVPGPDGARGVGGHCFPKDLNALIFLAKRLQVDPKIMQAAWDKNLEVRAPEDRDWEKMAGRAVSSVDPEEK